VSRQEEILRKLKNELYSKGQLNPSPATYDQASIQGLEQQDAQEQYRSELVKEYDETQQAARIHEEKEIRAQTETNPHEKYVDVVSERSPKGKFNMTLIGRPIDVFKLEDYLIFNISPLTNITLMRYNEVKAWEEAQGYGRKGIGFKKRKGGGFIIMMIVIIVIMLALGIVFLMYGPQILGMMTGMFGGMGG